ncbi:molybdenum ABC transporter ATP-binding protein [Litorilituus sediminis]|uniref:Molybdenum ABC transporter ATP-binding protein n=1 Tax=Litorilituus sediminis TaxID=718192 RepID=A0A4P6P5U8_9GAMM|nr:molybdenum ABC transporter ATP-binding protein [Litorilituus sediminis]QBG35529.1 molybdenum ABC transporter ATP-binding protein [Litorilituus sediminis]
MMSNNSEATLTKSACQTEHIQLAFNLSYHRQDNAKDSFSLSINATVPAKGITAIFGHSGSGKTTLLRCIAGLEPSAKGQLQIAGDTWQDDNYFMPTHKRSLGYVFQEASLFDHLTAKGNLDFAIKRADKPFDQALYQKVLMIMGIEGLLSRFPSQLSGGERQRVAIARALLIQPQILLMDEPLAALDLARKQEILPYLEKLRDNIDIPILYVSHAMDEVARLADHTLMLEKGQLIAQGEVSQVFSRLDLPGQFQQDTGVIIKAQVLEKDEQWHLMRVAFSGGDLWLKDSGETVSQTVRVRVLARDISLALSAQQDSSILNRLQASVIEIKEDNNEALALVRLQVGEEFLLARLTRRSLAHLQITVGKQVWAQVKSVAIVY